MTTMGSVTFLLCVLCLCCYQVTQGQMAMDCCLSVNNREIPRHLIKDYNIQVKGQGCSLDAVIFITKRDLKLCAPHDSDWVVRQTNHIDDCREKKSKSKHCKRYTHKRS